MTPWHCPHRADHKCRVLGGGWAVRQSTGQATGELVAVRRDRLAAGALEGQPPQASHVGHGPPAT